jgi:putative NADPH-quinone reductase
MKVFIVYCHPSEDSFTRHVRDAFIRGIVDAGHEYVLSDLYAMDFRTDMSEQEYLRDANYTTEPPLAADVLAEQAKVNGADAIAFIYPVFWTEAPAKLVGWFDRVWTYGFAYGERTMKTLDKALFLVTAGNRMERLVQFGLLDSMKKVMLGDRLFNRVRTSDFVVFDGMTKKLDSRQENWDANLQTAYRKGRELFKDE